MVQMRRELQAPSEAQQQVKDNDKIV
jgi:hypothetical protein